jgi:hypothetical protein
LAALGALLLLLLLLKKKKPPEPNLESEVTEINTMNEMDDYISEYGLSDGDRPAEHGDEEVDMPRVESAGGEYVSGEMNASEHNPDDLDDEFAGNGDEG